MTSSGTTTPFDPPSTGRRGPPLIAPPWHTVLLLLVLFSTSAANVAAQSHIRHQLKHTQLLNYAVTLLWEWTLAALVWWGLHLRGTPLRSVLGLVLPGARAWLRDMAVALLFWIVSMFVLALTALLLKLAHLHPEHIQQAVAQLAPSTPFELAVWFALSISAGICEELLFRGYFQRQFHALTGSAAVAIALQAVVFGAAHGYQGVPGILLIAVYGALFGVLARTRHSLRPGMLAHAGQDSLSGCALFALVHLSRHFVC